MAKQLATIIVALALCLIGCGWLPGHGDPVQLLTRSPDGGSGCFAATGSGLLVVDSTYGTAIVANNLESMVSLTDVPVAVAWRPGFTARRSGSEVEVLDPQGNAVAITGRNYRFWGGYVDAGNVFWACGSVDPLP